MKVALYQTSNVGVLGYIFSGVALLCFLIDFGFIVNVIIKNNNYVHTTGVIVSAQKSRDDKGDIMYAPVIEYQDNEGEPFTITSSLKSSQSPNIGDRVPVLYSPSDHSRGISARFIDLYFVPLLFLAFFLIFGCFGFFFLKSHFKRKSAVASLIKQGNRISANIVKINLDHSTSSNGKHPYIIVAQAMTGKKELEFESDPVWYDPEKVFKTGTVPVFIDPDDPRIYFVDTRVKEKK